MLFRKNDKNLESKIDFDRLPQHIAFIMDGNGRWAKKRGRLRTFGHKVGAESMDAVVRHARDLGIKVVSFFAFSTENWNRPKEEVGEIFSIARKLIVEKKESFLKSNMYKPNIKNIDPSLKQNGLLFTDPEVIRKFETFRNEYVHNGPWDLRSSVYYTAVNGEPADVIIYSPDMIDGHFVTSNSRNKFYSQNNRINEQLPNMIKEATQILMRTIDQISALYQKNTVRSENPKLTEEYMKAIADYYKSLI